MIAKNNVEIIVFKDKEVINLIFETNKQATYIHIYIVYFYYYYILLLYRLVYFLEKSAHS